MGKQIVLWGIGAATRDIILWLREHELVVTCVVDNFKYEFWKDYEQVPVKQPAALKNYAEQIVVLLAINFADAVCRQLSAYGTFSVYNLLHLTERPMEKACLIPYLFVNRSRGQRALCYILSGYEADLWEVVLRRIQTYQEENIDYCLISSGIYSKPLAKLAQKYGWSYLSTEQNQVGYIQNLVIELHPEAEYIFKLDEDIFIGEGFFSSMLEAYHTLEARGDYRINFLVPMIPLNCSGYVSFLKRKGLMRDFFYRFGRAYRSRFSAVFSREDVALYLWQACGPFDAAVEEFSKTIRYDICDCYYNIGCILYTRERWILMGRWPQNLTNTGMGDDERWILNDGNDKDLAIYEIQNVLAGHLAFGHQKERMKKFYRLHPEIFAIRE